MEFTPESFLQPVSSFPARPEPQPPQDSLDSDIYRGSVSFPITFLRPHSPDPSVTSSTSSTSSASTRLVRRALAAVVELAISRWARSSSSDTSSTTSSSSSSSRHARRRRRSSISTSTISISPEQRALAREALEKSRRVPREFTLFLPDVVPIPLPASPLISDHIAPQRTMRTSSLPIILSHLESALKHSARTRREKLGRARPARAILTSVKSPEIPSLDVPDNYFSQDRPANSSPAYPLPSLPRVTVTAPSPTTSSTNLQHSVAKSKQKQHLRASIGAPGPVDGGFASGQKAWWLDVACPTWEDMRSIGTLLHLHPLTLEDILHQDPREKLETFPRLGYYFIVFRAIDSRFHRFGEETTDATGNLNVTNVYLTVFREGICSFHFADISEHADRVRAKILQLEQEAVNMSSDHIAHGLMDSIVDAFMPLIREIEHEVEHVDALVAGMNEEAEYMDQGDRPEAVMIADRPSAGSSEKTFDGGSGRPGRSSVESSSGENEKAFVASMGAPKTPISTAIRRRCWTLGQAFRNFGPQFVHWIRRIPVLRVLFKKKRSKIAKLARTKTLLRMTSTRRVVTLLGRLLGPKTEVLGQLRKRLALDNLGTDLRAHLGDVQDHILTMQQSLVYYERVLSHSHPAYLSFLNTSLVQAKGGTDVMIFWMSTITIGTLCMQFPIGLFSMNVHVPQNRRPSDEWPPGTPVGKFRWFGVVIVINAVVLVALASMIRWWWVGAKKKYGRSLT